MNKKGVTTHCLEIFQPSASKICVRFAKCCASNALVEDEESPFSEYVQFFPIIISNLTCLRYMVLFIKNMKEVYKKQNKRF